MKAWRLAGVWTGMTVGALWLTFAADAEAQLKFSADALPFEIAVGQKAELAAFSPDGKLWARNAGGGKVVLWDLAAKREIAALEHLRAAPGPPLGVCHIEFSPDGGSLAVWNHYDHHDEDWELALWDVETRARRALPEPRGLVLHDMAFSPDGRRLATSAWKLGVARGGGKFPQKTKKKVKVWDAATGRELKLLGESAVAQVAFSPDGRWLATTHVENFRHGQVILWDAETLEERRKFKTDGGLGALVFSPDSKFVAASLDWHDRQPDGRAGVRVWDAETGKEHSQLAATGLPHSNSTLDFSPGGTRLAVVKLNTTNNSGLMLDRDGQFRIVDGSEIHVWDLATGRDETLERGLFWSEARFSPDDKFLATTFTNGESPVALGGVKLWDAKYWRVVRSLRMNVEADESVSRHSYGWVRQPRFSPDGRWLSAVWCNGPSGKCHHFLWDLSEEIMPLGVGGADLKQ